MYGAKSPNPKHREKPTNFMRLNTINPKGINPANPRIFNPKILAIFNPTFPATLNPTIPAILSPTIPKLFRNNPRYFMILHIGVLLELLGEPLDDSVAVLLAEYAFVECLHIVSHHTL